MIGAFRKYNLVRDSVTYAGWKSFNGRHARSPGSNKVILFLFYLNIKEIYSLKVNNQTMDNKITDRLVNLKRMQIFF